MSGEGAVSFTEAREADVGVAGTHVRTTHAYVSVVDMDIRTTHAYVSTTHTDLRATEADVGANAREVGFVFA